eukprot:scaffold17_cov124-Isochrysis_galbana.AAC.5
MSAPVTRCGSFMGAELVHCEQLCHEPPYLASWQHRPAQYSSLAVAPALPSGLVYVCVSVLSLPLSVCCVHWRLEGLGLVPPGH